MHKQDLATEEQIVRTRSAQRFAQAKWDNEHEDPSAFARAAGPGFELSKLPATSKLLNEVADEAAVVAGMAKVYFHEKSPVTQEPVGVDYRAWTCDANPKDPKDRTARSYPSGHANMGYTLAIVLSALMPQKSQVVLERAFDYAFSRQVRGDHYRSDVEASHALGNAVGVMLLHNAAFKPDFDAAKAELRAAHLTGE